MSIRVMTAVWDNAPVDGGEMLVLLALAGVQARREMEKRLSDVCSRFRSAFPIREADLSHGSVCFVAYATVAERWYVLVRELEDWEHHGSKTARFG